MVTGAAKPESIGHEVALRLLKEGMQVVVLDLYEDGFASLPGCRCIKCDASEPAAVERAFAGLERLDVLVNCVGGSWGITPADLVARPPLGFRGLTNCTLEDWRTIVAANLDSVFYVSRAAAPLLKKQGGAIVNVASVAARKGIPPGSEGSSGPYAVAKAGVMGLTRQLELAYRQALRALEALAGRYPAAALEVPAQLAARPAPAPAGMPSELLERRPDVVAAERRVAAAFYRVEEAKAARLPSLSLSASVSSISSDLFVLQDRDSPVWSIGGKILAPLFTGGALQSQVEIRTAEQKLALAEYGRVGARAFGEVESALATEAVLEARRGVLRQAVLENERALELANIRYRVGASDLRAVQQQQLAVFAARTTLLRVQSEQLVQRVNLHLALGGGWEGS
jgi:NAD(P)-dependent dehydrogenase (short-subunit alcohol dehydrogenase family)